MARKTDSDFVDIAGLLKQYLRKWYLFVISVVVCLGLAFLYTHIRQQDYAVKANILIADEDESPMMAGALGEISSLFGSSARVDDEIFIISSHSLYTNVCKQLGINVNEYVKTNIFKRELAYPENPIAVTSTPLMFDTLQRTIVFKLKVNKSGKAAITAKLKRSTVVDEEDLTLPFTVNTPLGEFTFSKTEYFPADNELDVKISVTGYETAAEALDEDVLAEIASKRSNVVSLSLNTPNTVYGKAVLDDIVTQYNKRGIAESKAQNQLTATFIDQRLELISKELNDVEAQIQSYKQKKGITDIEVDLKYQTEKRGRVEAELLAAETAAEITKLTADFVKDPANKYALVPMNIENESLGRAISAHNELVLQRMNMSASARADNQAMKLLSEQIDASRKNILESINSAYNQAMVNVRDLRRENSTMRGDLTAAPVVEREYRELARQQELKQALFLFLLQRREETAMLLANAYPKGQIVDKAFTLSEPLGMRNMVIYILALFLGMIIPPMWLYLRRLINNRIESRADVERITNVPILGEMCIDNSGHKLVVGSEDTTASAELFRLMRSNLLFILNDPRDKVVLMTSTSSGEGKSFISINLAASLALLGKKVCLVGMDIRNPRLSDYLGISPRFGLTQYLSSNQVNIKDIIVPFKEVNDLDVIVAGPIPPNPAELLLSTKVEELFEELRKMYDYVIVDTAPIGLVSDTFTLDRIADAAIYVCRANYTSMRDLQLVNDIYEQHRLKKVSLVVNGSAAKKTYGYGRKNSKS